jgi:hypothetical protein
MSPSGATTTPEPDPPRTPSFTAPARGGGRGGGTDGKADHRRADAVDDIDHRARVGVEQRLILGRHRLRRRRGSAAA